MTEIDAKYYAKKFEAYRIKAEVYHGARGFGLKLFWNDKAVHVLTTEKAHRLLMEARLHGGT